MQFPFPTPPAPGTTLDVAPGIAWLRMPLPFALDHINLWVVDGDRGMTLVDTGYGDDANRALWDALFASTLRDRPVVEIVVTHYHPDHIGNAAWLAKRFDVVVAMTAAEYLTAHAVHGQTAGFGLEDTCALFRSHGVEDAHVQALQGRGNRYRAGVPELPTRYRRLYPGMTLRMGERFPGPPQGASPLVRGEGARSRAATSPGESHSGWTLIGGYGHSPEHAALYSVERRALISGDMLLPRISTNISVWPAEPEGDPLAKFLASLDAFEALPDDTLVLPSHGLPFRGIAERVDQLRTHHADRLRELADAVPPGGATAADVVPVLFRRELDAQQRFFAVGEAIAHLNHLVANGALVRHVDASGCVRFTPSRWNAAA